MRRFPGIASMLVLFAACGTGRASEPRRADLTPLTSNILHGADVGQIFGSWDEWESAYGDFVSALDAFDNLSKEPIETAERLVAVMAAHDRVYRSARDVEGYLYLRLQLNGADEEARSREHLLDETDRRWYTTGSPWFTRAVTDLGRERIEDWMAGEATLRRYDFFFRRFFDRAEHPYPEGQDELRTLASIFERQSDRVYKALAISEAPVVEVTLESGERLELNPGRARTILEELSSGVDRRAVSKAWLEALGRQSQTYAALLEGIVKRQELLAEVRQFDSALSAQLHSDAIPADGIRTAIRVAREASAPLRRYHSLRKSVLELDEYGLADRFVSLDQGEREIDFDEARRLIVDSSSALGPEVQVLVERAFSQRWIDSIERPGKRAHGGATFVPAGEHPFVLVNYRGSLENVFQLTHEIGHAVHALIAHQTQLFVYAHPSSLTGEAVAGVFEGALVEHMVGRAANREEKIRVLDLSIQNILRLFYRPMLDADFELRIYETDGPITGPSLGALYFAVVADFYGEAVSLNDWDAHSWQETPHYYTSPLYMGRYGLSSAAANTLISQLMSPIDSEQAQARQALLDLMRSGSSGYPIDLLRLAGADLSSPLTIEILVARLESLVDELERALPPKRARVQPRDSSPSSKVGYRRCGISSRSASAYSPGPHPQQATSARVIQLLRIAAAQPTPGRTLRAPSEQFITQAPHSIHRSGSRISTAPFRGPKTGWGQTFMHSLQPLHLVGSSPIVVTPLI